MGALAVQTARGPDSPPGRGSGDFPATSAAIV